MSIERLAVIEMNQITPYKLVIKRGGTAARRLRLSKNILVE